MKKSLLALAVLGAFAGAAFAQSNVTVYGVADVGVVHATGAAAGSVWAMTSGNQSGSRLGFKGTEDLGGGLKANFVLENGYSIDTGALGQGGLIFGRRATVGLAGSFGEVNFGRRNTPYFNTLDSLDPMGTGLAGSSTNLFATTGVRMNNSVIYSTPGMSGFSGELAYGFGEVAGNTSGSRQISLAASYSNGPLMLALAHHNANNAAATDSTKNTLLGGTYNFGAATVHGAYATTKGAGTVDSKDWLLGVTVPFGASAVTASYIRHDDKTAADMDANQFALGYTYAMSKRTNLYTSYATVSNKNGAAFATNTGLGDKEFNVGIRHKF